MAGLRSGNSTDGAAKAASTGSSKKVQKNSRGKSKLQNIEEGKLLEKKAEAQRKRDAKQKDLEELQREVEDIQSRLNSEVSEDTKLHLENELKEKLTHCQAAEKSVSSLNGDIGKIENDLMEIDGDTNEAQGNNTPINVAQATETRFNDTPENDTTTSGSQENDKNTNEDSEPLFVDQMDSSFEGRIPSRDPSREASAPPEDYQDYPSTEPASDDDESSDKLFDDGTVILKKNSRGGCDYLNSYGPRNSAMTIWCSSHAPNEVADCTYLKGKPHSDAIKTDERTGKVLFKGKINSIKKVAWQPREGGTTMLDLVESVRELDPQMKKTNPMYHYPLTTLLVDWKSDVNLPAVWITRSVYRELTSTAAKEVAKSDRRIYAIALHQVKNYRNCVGKQLDDNWNGEKREGNSQSPSPPPGFPEVDEQPLAQTQATPPQINQASNDSTPASNDSTAASNDSTPISNNSTTTSNGSTPATNDNTSASNAPAPNTGASDQSDQSQNAQTDQPMVKKPLSRCFDLFCVRNRLDLEPKDWRELLEEPLARFIVMAEAYVEEQKKQNVMIYDDMEMGRASPCK